MSDPGGPSWPETLFGLTPADSGEIVVAGTPVTISSPADAIRAGIGFVPEDRRQHGVILDMSIAANASLASLGAVSHRGLIDGPKERAAAAGYIEQLRIKAPSPATEVGGPVRRQPAEGRTRALVVDHAGGAHSG